MVLGQSTPVLPSSWSLYTIGHLLSTAPSSTHILFLDFAKPFDSVPHGCLLLKLEAIGIQGNLLIWLQNYLSNRLQRVVINRSMSSWMEVKSGVPQGTILGPLLFIIYINDIDVGLPSNVSLFADDFAIYREVSSTKDCEILQNDLHLLCSWALKWQLKLNICKCKALQITRKPLVFTYKFLGLQS